MAILKKKKKKKKKEKEKEKEKKIKKRQLKQEIYKILASIYSKSPTVNVPQASANPQYGFLRTLTLGNDPVTPPSRPPPSSRRRLEESPPLPSFRLPTFGGSKRKHTKRNTKKTKNIKKTNKKSKKHM
jgi:hypothetical protein